MAVSSDKSANSASNTSLNSLANSETEKRNRVSSRKYSVEARVYHAIDASEIELKPCEIARIIYNDGSEDWLPKRITSGQYTTVRGACTKLLQKGQILSLIPEHTATKSHTICGLCQFICIILGCTRIFART